MLITTDDIRIESLNPLIAPAILMEELPLDQEAAAMITDTRKQASTIVQGKNNSLLVVVGPCSIHDVDAAKEYASNLKKLIEIYKNELCIIMRVYFEKPRTTIGWKGLINDPELNDTFKINHGLRVARKLLLDLAKLGVAAGTEFLDPIVPQFIADVISWGAIGARTTESQVHRELASGLSMPVGFKNGTDGNIQIAIDAVYSSTHPHHFLSITKQGVAAIVNTKGNDACHLILRGGRTPNYSQQHIEEALTQLQQKKLNSGIMIDCSHGNSEKNHTKQKIVVDHLISQMRAGSSAIAGVMIESNLLAGKQTLSNKDQLCYGQSITDACIDWQETETLLAKLAEAVQQRRMRG